VVAVAVLVVFIVVVLGVLWARFASSHAERQSVRSYQRVLGALGGVAKRSDASAPVHHPDPEELGRPHVLPSDSPDLFRPAQSALRQVPAPRVRLEPPTPPGYRPRRPPVAAGPPQGDAPAPHPEAEPDTILVPAVVLGYDDGAGAEPGVGGHVGASQPAVVFDAEADAPIGQLKPPRSLRRLHPHHHQIVRRAATGAAAAVALSALGVGVWQLAGSREHTPSAVTSTSTTPTSVPARSAGAGASGGSSTPKQQGHTPTTLQPTSSSATIVAYAAPAGTYTVTFKTSTGACWLGAQAQPNGPWLKMWSLNPGQSAQYTANGPLILRLGAPQYVSIQVNGVPVQLPAGKVNPYDISFTPSASTSV